MQQLESSVPQVNAIRLARVSRSYPAKHAVDVVFLDDGGFAAGVPILTASASQEHGLAYLPKVAEPDDDNGRWSLRLTGKDDVLCAVAWAGGTPVVLGFFFPAGEHMAVEENELLDKHVSGFTRHITPDGDMTLEHPSGWKVCMHKSGGVVLQVGGASVVVKPDGKVYLNSVGSGCDGGGSGGSGGDEGEDGDDGNEDLAASLPDFYLLDASYAPALRNYPVLRTGKSDSFDTSRGIYTKIDGLYSRPGYSDRTPFSLDNAEIYFITLSSSPIDGGIQITRHSDIWYSHSTLGDRYILCEKVVSIIDGVPVRGRIDPETIIPCRLSGFYETGGWNSTSVYVNFGVDIPIFDSRSYEQWSEVIVSLLHRTTATLNRAASGVAYTFIFDADQYPGLVYTNLLRTQGGDNYTLSWTRANALTDNELDPGNRLPYLDSYIKIETGIPGNPTLVPR